jgi:hypothetical protein
MNGKGKKVFCILFACSILLNFAGIFAGIIFVPKYSRSRELLSRLRGDLEELEKRIAGGLESAGELSTTLGAIDSGNNRAVQAVERSILLSDRAQDSVAAGLEGLGRIEEANGAGAAANREIRERLERSIVYIDELLGENGGGTGKEFTE